MKNDVRSTVKTGVKFDLDTLESLALALGPKSLVLWLKSFALALALGSESLALALRHKFLLTSLTNGS